MNKNIGLLDPDGKFLNPLNNQPYSALYKELAKEWSQYPAYKKFDQILNAIQHNQITFIISGTGSGKTVLIPKIALHYTNYNGKVAVTLPKRISVSSAASFAAATLDVKLGNEVGYAHKNSPQEFRSINNKILYMTDGYLIMKMVNDPTLSEYDVIIIDEAHERRIQIDLILLFFKTILKKRNNVKIVIMSATIDGEKYQQYFNEFKTSIVYISGKPNYPIDVHFLDNESKSYMASGQHVLDNIINISKQDILFFVTTSNEALDLCKKIRSKYGHIYCIELFSDMDDNFKIYAELKDEFRKLGNYTQKLVIATNVAESSITINGLKYVVDSGYELYSYYNTDCGAQTLEKKQITQAQALQRRGRVGRTEPGICYHLLTQVQFNNLGKYPAPDILRQDLTGEIIKIIQLTDTNTLFDALNMIDLLMDPPNKNQIDNAVALYNLYKIIDESGKITNVGRDISRFNSLPLNRALFLIYSYQMYCAREATQIIAMFEKLDGKLSNLFYKEDALCIPNKRKQSNQSLEKYFIKKSDHLTYLNIFQDYNKAIDKNQWAKHRGIKLDLLKKISELAKQYYYKIVNISKAPQMSRENNMTLNEKIITILKLSHQHQTANKLTTVYPFRKQNGKINRDSVVLHNKNIASHRFIYDKFVCINGDYEFSGITFI